MSLSSTLVLPAPARARGGERAVAIWLLCCCAMIFAMVVIGGITRLTLSGLSITEWQPVTGILPPLSETAWLAEFHKYQQIPQYKLLNAGMSLADFKYIFLWEYVHRLWGRLIGFVYAAPFLWFVLRRQVPRRLTLPLAGIFLLGAAQGALGWWMVKSGLADRVEVSQYRLVAHLLLALAIYGLTLWIALGLLARGQLEVVALESRHSGARPEAVNPESRNTDRRNMDSGFAAERRPGMTVYQWRRLSEGLIALVALTIAAGGFTAGLHAGLTYNTFPLMDGHFVPTGYAQLTPFIRNGFENVPAVQFDHRLLAETTALCVLLLWLAGRGTTLPRPAQLALHALLAAAALQFTLGVSTLLLVVPIPLAAAHQAGAVLLLTAAIVFRHTLR